MTTRRRTRIATQNTKATLSDRIAERCLNLALNQQPDVWNGQEWGPNRNDVLRDLGRLTVWGGSKAPGRAGRRADPGDYLFVRHHAGGEPLGFSDRYHIVNVERVILSEGRAVRPQPGTRRVEDDNDATLVTTLDRARNNIEAVFLNGHLPAHVETRGSYRFPDDPRAAMHREARAKAANLGADYVALDTNWHAMRLAGYLSCWEATRPVGTLGKRAIDTVYAHRSLLGRTPTKAPVRARVYGTPAREHKLVVVDWPW